MTGDTLASSFAQLIQTPDRQGTPLLSGHCHVYGYVRGDVRITGSAVILPGEEICNDTRDTFVLTGKGRSVIRGSDRETLLPKGEVSAREKRTKERGRAR